jgi:general secretion pathway protein K
MGEADRGGERGLALVSVLWALSILSLIAAVVLSSSSLSYRLQHNNWAQAEARSLADAILNRAVLALMDTRPEMRWRVDGVPRDIAFNGVNARVTIEDELGKIDLNTAGGDLIRRLFQAADLPSGVTDNMADKVLDWRESDGLKRLHGADEADYQNAHLSYGPRGRAFQSVGELRLVLGMTEELFARIEPAITVYSQRPTIDLQNASPLALRSLSGLDEQKANEIVAARTENSSSISNRALPAGVMDPLVPLAGRAFSIKIEIQKGGHRIVEKAVIRLTGDPKNPYWLLALDETR